MDLLRDIKLDRAVRRSAGNLVEAYVAEEGAPGGHRAHPASDVKRSLGGFEVDLHGGPLLVALGCNGSCLGTLNLDRCGNVGVVGLHLCTKEIPARPRKGHLLSPERRMSKVSSHDGGFQGPRLALTTRPF